MFEVWASTDERIAQARQAAGPRGVYPLPEQLSITPRRDGVVVIQIRGTILRHEELLASGEPAGVSSIAIADAISRAAADEGVAAVVLWIDSPGGSGSAGGELAEAVSAFAKVKNIVAVVDGMCTSAAYWFASQARAIYASHKLNLLGAMGVYQIVIDSSAMMENLGLRVLRVRSGDLKGIGAYGVPVSETEVAEIQRLVTGMAFEFSADVARGRRLPPDVVRGLADGRVFYASHAAQLKLIDGIKSIGQVLADINNLTATAIRANQPLYALAADAAQFSKAVSKRMKSGDRESDAIYDAKESHPKLFQCFQQFKALPEWKRTAFSDQFEKGIVV